MSYYNEILKNEYKEYIREFVKNFIQDIKLDDLKSTMGNCYIIRCATQVSFSGIPP